MKAPISYCVSVCNEHIELNLLLTQLKHNLTEDDEILIQGDQGNVTDEVSDIVTAFTRDSRIRYIEFPLNGDFAAFKNNFLLHAKNPWIFQIDADELVSETLLEHIHFLLLENNHIESFSLPRVNIVQGLTPSWADTWHWRVVDAKVGQLDYHTKSILSNYGIKAVIIPEELHEEKLTIQLVNFPDYQNRLFKAGVGIKWRNKVHEVLFKEKNQFILEVKLPHKYGTGFDFDYCLFHVKQLNRQIRQNEMYSKM